MLCASTRYRYLAIGECHRVGLGRELTARTQHDHTEQPTIGLRRLPPTHTSRCGLKAGCSPVPAIRHRSPLTISVPNTACSEAFRGCTCRWLSWLDACVQPPRPRLLNLAEIDRKPPVRRFSASLCQKVKPSRGFLRVLPYLCQRTHERTRLSQANVGLSSQECNYTRFGVNIKIVNYRTRASLVRFGSN